MLTVVQAVNEAPDATTGAQQLNPPAVSEEKQTLWCLKGPEMSNVFLVGAKSVPRLRGWISVAEVVGSSCRDLDPNQASAVWGDIYGCGWPVVRCPKPSKPPELQLSYLFPKSNLCGSAWGRWCGGRLSPGVPREDALSGDERLYNPLTWNVHRSMSLLFVIRLNC